jgi:hypothetical protein
VVRGGSYRVGLFAGYHYFNEQVKAFGCTQTAANPFICRPSISTSVEGITQDNQWQSVRLGVDGSVFIGDRFAFSAEAVWLPYAILNGVDDHLLRADLGGGIKEDGTGHGYQFEALLSYKVTRSAAWALAAVIGIWRATAIRILKSSAGCRSRSIGRAISSGSSSRAASSSVFILTAISALRVVISDWHSASCVSLRLLTQRRNLLLGHAPSKNAEG